MKKPLGIFVLRGVFDKEMPADLSGALQDNRQAAHAIFGGISVFGKRQIELQGDEVCAKMKTDQLLSK
ncbi:hypothetical protein [Collimonas humicola]|uniref:hypothetical protein n=1 Tax=Collimonas humicola TaxID=2825886 RepID=UPI001B8B71FC|nr:hypothetical protein [Collimonas humicola]